MSDQQNTHSCQSCLTAQTQKTPHTCPLAEDLVACTVCQGRGWFLEAMDPRAEDKEYVDHLEGLIKDLEQKLETALNRCAELELTTSKASGTQS